MFKAEPAAAPPAPPCAICGDRSEAQAWGNLLCIACFSAWHRDPGVKAASALHYTADTATAYRKATAAFIARSKRVAA